MPGRIGEFAQSQLRQSAYFALRDIRCACEDGVLTLCGRLPSYYLKQMAQALVTNVEGVSSVVNRIEVMTSRPRVASGYQERQP